MSQEEPFTDVAGGDLPELPQEDLPGSIGSPNQQEDHLNNAERSHQSSNENGSNSNRYLVEKALPPQMATALQLFEDRQNVKQKKTASTFLSFSSIAIRLDIFLLLLLFRVKRYRTASQRLPQR